MKTNYRISFILLFAAVFLFLETPGAHAQYFSFGKNRIQYENFEWRFIQSEHFDVYYYKEKNYDIAVFAALSLESSLRQYQEDYNHRIVDRIEVILYDSHNDFAQTNVVGLPINIEGLGGVTDRFKNRITMPFKGDYAQFRAILQHELNHAVLNDMFYGGSAQALLSRTAIQLPLWFNEGIGEYESRGWDTEQDAFIRDAVLNDYFPPLRQLNSFPYRGGQAVWNYIVQEYGRNKISEILEAVQATRSIERAWERTLGLTFEEFSERMEDYYREIYFPSVAERNNIDEFADQLTDRGKVGTYNTSPTLSPEGDKIAIISNHLRSFDVVVLNTITGEVLKTLVEGRTNPEFAELNILNTSMTWSPDGSKFALSAKYEGEDRIAIIDYRTEEKQFLTFPEIDAIGSVAWSPDGQKLAFDGNIGPLQDIFVYNLQTEELQNITNDALNDGSPVWGNNSEVIYFTSSRGDQLEPGAFQSAPKMLATDDMYTTDIYAIQLGSGTITRLTNSPDWNESEPEITREGRLLFVSDKNGINNIYSMNLETGQAQSLTNLQTGAQQFSVSGDGSIMAVSTINEGYRDIFLISNPFTRQVETPLSDSHWANRRAEEARINRVPATGYVQNLARNKAFITFTEPLDPIAASDTLSPFIAARQDTLTVPNMPDTTDSTQAQQQDEEGLDFRNYVFNEEVTEDSAFVAEYMDENPFEVENNTTDDERYIPTDYRLHFSVDLVFAGGGFSTYYGTYGLAQIQFSDLLGNHRIAFGSSLNFDLVNSNYFLQYGNFEDRVDYLFFLSHSSFNINRARRFRYFTGGMTIRYPLNTYKRFDFKLAGINIASDFSLPGFDQDESQSTSFAYPQVIFTNDQVVYGLITPIAGFRYSIAAGGSPPFSSKTLQFASVLGDFRKYFHLGGRYSIALRGSGGLSFGRDSQTYFMGGVLGWINGKANDFTTPSFQIDDLGSAFITAPAIPLRGFERFAAFGDKFALANLEFRFPLFAAILPGPIPVLPLFNITGLAFVDAGFAWGQNVFYNIPGSQAPYYTNDADLDFTVRNEATEVVNGVERPAPEGDILIGAGFGLRAIVFGLPLRYDVGWPYYRSGFGGDPIHYISIGIDF